MGRKKSEDGQGEWVDGLGSPGGLKTTTVWGLQHQLPYSRNPRAQSLQFLRAPGLQGCVILVPTSVLT